MILHRAAHPGARAVGVRRHRRTTAPRAARSPRRRRSLTAQEAGLSFVTVEREDVGGTVRHYPRKKLVLTRPVTVPGYGKLNVREVTKEDLIARWEEIVRTSGLEVATSETVTAVGGRPGGPASRSRPRPARSRPGVSCWRSDVAGVPRKLGVPGEELPTVAYSLREPESFQGDRILVVGGGDSAVEAALALAEQPGNEVRMSYRGQGFRRIKPKNHERVEAAVSAGGLDILWNTNLLQHRVRTPITYRNGGHSGDASAMTTRSSSRAENCPRSSCVTAASRSRRGSGSRLPPVEPGTVRSIR